MGAHKLISLLGAMAGVLALSACDISAPSHIEAGKMRIQEQMVAEKLDASRVNVAHVAKIADRFLQKGRSDMVLTVAFLSGDKASRARADKLGAAYKKALEQYGVPRVALVTVPVTNQEHAAEAIITYNSLVALAAEDCLPIPGHLGAEPAEDVHAYRFGCESQAALSKMIANPSDLMGKGGTQNNDSRRSGTIIEPYRSGVPNQPIGGFQASGIGGG